jgi:hypothetical protein
MSKLDTAIIDKHPTLNSKLWKDGQTLRPEVQVALFKIAKEFFEFLDFAAPLVDVQITGSQANYNYSSHSDLDLHLIVPYSKVDCDQPVADLFDTKRKLWKQQHDITIRGVPVELYVEDTDKPVRGSAYSIMTDQWLREPDPTEVEVDDVELRREMQIWLERMNTVVQSRDLQKMQDLKDQLQQYRKDALARNGEYALENLVYKSLRNLGVISELMTAIGVLKDQELSI